MIIPPCPKDLSRVPTSLNRHAAAFPVNRSPPSMNLPSGSSTRLSKSPGEASRMVRPVLGGTLPVPVWLGPPAPKVVSSEPSGL